MTWERVAYWLMGTWVYNAPRILWWAALFQLLSGFASIITMQAFVMTFMENWQTTHADASFVYGTYGLVGSIFGLCMSPLMDMFAGPHLLLSFALLSAVLRGGLVAVLVLGQGPTIGIILILVTLASDIIVGVTIGLVIARACNNAGVLRSANNNAFRNRVYSVSYSLVNAAAALGSLLYDQLRIQCASTVQANAAAHLSAGLAMLLIVPASAGAWRALHAQRQQADRMHQSRAFSSQTPVWRDPTLIRFSIVCFLLMAARMIFRHLDTTLPVVMIHTQGAHARFALVQGLNGLLLIFLAPLMQHWTARVRHYPMMIVGTAIAAVSFAPLLVPWPRSMAVPPLVPYIAFIVLFSVSEALWSARFGSYATTVAPTQHIATYQALASIPSMLTKPFVAWSSSTLVKRFCPSAAGTCQPVLLWGIIAAGSAISPLGLLLLRRCIDPDRETILRKGLLRRIRALDEGGSRK